jgi:hypothetical protein
MYLRGRKLIALPDADMLAAAFAGTEAQGDTSELVGGLGILKPVAWLTLVLTAIVTVLVLPFLVMRRKARPERRWGMLAGLGYIFPGTSSRLAPTGGMLLAAWTYCLIVVVLVVQGDTAGGVDELGRIVESTFGVSGKIVFPFESAMMIFGPAAFVGLWVLNGVLLARATKFAKAMARAAAQPAKPGDADDTDKDEASKEVPPASPDAEEAEETEEAEEVEQAGEDDEPSEDAEDDDEQEQRDDSDDEDEGKDSSPESSDEIIMTPDLLKEPAPKKPTAPAAEQDEESKGKPAAKPSTSSRKPTPPPEPTEDKPAVKSSTEKPVDKKKKSESASAGDADADEDKNAKPDKDVSPNKDAGPDNDEDEDEDDYQPL